MFIELDGDAEQAELFALGLIKEEVAFQNEYEKRLFLVPCKHKVFCRTHGTFWSKVKTTKMKYKQYKLNTTH